LNDIPADARIARPSDRSIAFVTVAVLALATLAAAWSSYEAARWSGVQASSYSQAAARRVDSTRAATQAGQLALYDNTVFSAWIGARSTGNSQLETFELARFRPEFRVAFEAWLATRPFDDPTAPSSPFVLPAYELGLAKTADDLEAQTSTLFGQGVSANQRADDYVLNTVFLAAALFFAGIASRFAWRAAELAMLGLAIATLTSGVVNIARYPIH
jgi:hypothetical protein